MLRVIMHSMYLYRYVIALLAPPFLTELKKDDLIVSQEKTVSNNTAGGSHFNLE